MESSDSARIAFGYPFCIMEICKRNAYLKRGTGTNPATLIDRDDATQIKQLTSMDEEATDLFSD